MELQHLTFFSTRGRELSHNLELIRQDFRKRNPHISFDYYIANFVPAAMQDKTKDALGEVLDFKELVKERNQYSKTCGNLISCDLSVSGKASGFPDNQKRILIMEPYDYIFQKLYNEQCLGKVSKLPSSDLKNYTDVIPYSSYIEQFVKEYYDIPQDLHVHSDIGIPFADSLHCMVECAQYRQEAEHIFPALKGKKIISLITSSAEQEGNYTSFVNLDLKEIFSSLSEEWVIVTNNLPVISKCFRFSSSMQNRIIYCTKKIFELIKLLYFTDILISDAPYYICTFAAKKTPFYVVDYCNNYFSRYIKEVWPELMLGDLNTIADIAKNCKYTEQQHLFSEQYAPFSSGESLKKLYQLFRN